MKKPHWSENELNILKTHYNKLAREDLLKLLPRRTWRGLTDKAKELHLYRFRKYPRWGYPTKWKPVDLNLTEIQKGYLAGVIDGEGSIMILSTKFGTRYSPTVVIANCEKVFIDYIHKTIGLGKVYVQTPKKPRRKQYRLQIGRQLEVFSLLKAIKSYLVSKKRLASLMVRYCKSRLDRGALPGRNIIYTIEESRLAEKIRSLNELSHRGDHKRKVKNHMNVLKHG